MYLKAYLCSYTIAGLPLPIMYFSFENYVHRTLYNHYTIVINIFFSTISYFLWYILNISYSPMRSVYKDPKQDISV